MDAIYNTKGRMSRGKGFIIGLLINKMDGLIGWRRRDLYLRSG